MCQNVLVSFKNDSIIFPLQKKAGSLRVIQDGSIRTIDSIVSAFSCQYDISGASQFTDVVVLQDIFCGQSGFSTLKKRIIEKNNHHDDLLCDVPSSNANILYYSINRANFLNYKKETVWYLDMPLPDRKNKITSDAHLPSDFPMQMPIDKDMIWPLQLWSDYLFATLWFSLYEPYFHNHSSSMSFIGNNCRISESAILIPPFHIGDNVTIEDGAIISGSYVGAYSRIGQGCIVRNSILFEGVSIPIGIYVVMSVIGDGSLINSHIRFSITGQNAFIGGGVYVTDVILHKAQDSYHNKKTIMTSNCNETIDSMACVLGCALGDNVKVGSGVFLKPGATVESGERVLKGISNE